MLGELRFTKHGGKEIDMKKLCGLLAFSLLLTVGSFAQSGAEGDVPATREDVVKLFDLMHVQQQTRSAIEAMVKQQRAMVREALRKRHPEMEDEQLKHLDSFMDDFWKDFPIDQMLDDMIPVYQKHLTKTDVDAMSTFYSSPTGKKLLSEMPAIMSESMQAMMPHLRESMDKMMDRVEKQAESEKKKQAKPTTDKN
jgi:uncharacterized protein